MVRGARCVRVDPYVTGPRGPPVRRASEVDVPVPVPVVLPGDVQGSGGTSSDQGYARPGTGRIAVDPHAGFRPREPAVGRFGEPDVPVAVPVVLPCRVHGPVRAHDEARVGRLRGCDVRVDPDVGREREVRSGGRTRKGCEQRDRDVSSAHDQSAQESQGTPPTAPNPLRVIKACPTPATESTNLRGKPYVGPANRSVAPVV